MAVVCLLTRVGTEAMCVSEHDSSLQRTGLGTALIEQVQVGQHIDIQRAPFDTGEDSSTEAVSHCSHRTLTLSL